MTDPTAHPLTWPANRSRTPAGRRKRGQFGSTKEIRSPHGTVWREKAELSIASALERVLQEMTRFEARYALISSDVELRRDGLPRSDRREPADPGVAVYFTKDGDPYCLACDTFERVADNLAAIAGHVEATRRQMRYGVATAAESLQAFRALPPPDVERPWRDVLELRSVPVDAARVKAAFVRLARERHPDAGGSDAMMAELNAARDQALQEMA